MADRVVIGLDGGGSTTRVACADLDGRILSTAVGTGANPQHAPNAAATVRETVLAALELAGRRPSDVAALVAGLAGLNAPEDEGWATEIIAIDGMPGRAINDSEVALAGAFLDGPGIVALSGTGSIILGRSAAGELLREDWYQYYAGAARHLAFGVVQSISLGEAGPDDAALVTAALRHWEVADLPGLRARLRDDRHRDYDEVKYHYARFAPVITSAANSSALAARACDWLAGALARGVRLLALDLGVSPAPVALIGAVARSPAIATRIPPLLPDCEIVEPALDPVSGATLLALRDAGVATTPEIVARLREGTS